MGWKETKVPKNLPGIEENARAFICDVWDGQLKLLVGCSKEIGWHMSISHVGKNGKPTRRLPYWEEIRDARYEFIPDEFHMVMILPPKKEYVNLHPTTMHLHQERKDMPIRKRFEKFFKWFRRKK